MSWIKWIIKWTIICAIPFGLPAAIAYKFLKAWLRLAFHIDLFIAYLPFRIGLFFFIQLPLHLVGKSAHEITHFFHAAHEMARRAKIFTSAVFLFTFGIGLILFPVSVPTSVGAYLDPSVWITNISVLGLVGFISGMITLTFDAIRFHFSSLEVHEVVPQASPGAAAKGEVMGAAGAAMGGAAMANEALDKVEKGMEAKEKVEKGKKTVETARKIKKGGSAAEEGGMYLGDLESLAGNILGDIPGSGFIGSMGAEEAGAEVAAEAAAEGAAAEAGGAAAVANPVGLTLIAAILYILVWAGIMLVFQAVLFSIAFLWTAKILGGLLYGPFMEAVGLSTAYGGLIADNTLDRFGFNVGEIDAFEEMGVATQKALKKGQCILKGPQCYRQWRLNNTKRPDSEDVGETYGLTIERFRLGSGSQVDIAYKTKNYAIPLAFRISNTRHGLKGIDAKNIAYRIKITDSDHGKKFPYCDTGWVNISGYNIDGNGNDLYPGTSASSGFEKLKNPPGDALTLDECKMLQPGAGKNLRAYLQVKYDYFSQATIYFKAMSRAYQNANNIEVKSKNSKTADTPVKAAMRVDSPVVFDQNNSANDQPVSMGATLKSGDPDIEYKVRDLQLRKSSRTKIRRDTNSLCSFQKDDEASDPDVLELGVNGSSYEDPQSLLLAQHMSPERKDKWFSKKSPPSIFGCLFELNREEYSFNPSGETLTMDMKTNYTVKTEKRLNNFRVLNSNCRRMNCPVIYFLKKLKKDVVMANKEDTKRGLYDEEEYWKKVRATCDGPDAYDGCMAVEEYDRNRGPGDGVENSTIRQGDIAVKVSQDLKDEYFSCKLQSGEKKFPNPAVTGFQEDRLIEVVKEGRARVLSFDSGQWRIQRGQECSS